MTEPKSTEGLWWALDHIKNDLDKLEAKMTGHATNMAVLIKTVNHLNDRVEKVSTTLTVDNGKPSVLSQLRDVNSDLKEMKSLIRHIKEVQSALTGIQTDVALLKGQVGAKTPKEVQIEKWKTIGKISGGVMLVLPGILSFLHDLFAS